MWVVLKKGPFGLKNILRHLGVPKWDPLILATAHVCCEEDVVAGLE